MAADAGETWWLDGHEGIDVWVTYARGLDPRELVSRLPEGARPLVVGSSQGWAYAVEQVGDGTARTASDDWNAPALRASADGTDVLFFQTRSWDAPSQFMYARGGQCITWFGLGCGGEEDERAGEEDVLASALQAAGIVGDDTSRYEEDEEFNLDGWETVRVICEHFSAPLPPLRATA
ncbi:hypothetical protein F7R91_38960 [Streptomyces luteolifulvus]|jgi:hypothetical protein|uniref:Uncharacterized protein n=1 Tax=Streptomyces luteolifulvus TaxID=2615112 RepID=A0A6H9UNU0_9ACTN|nr:hypothetical protein [Streptomyces luteolifulvus]KAB1139672.1 hypothetical protein F7R91_38960 [Streptomyces luteolifulvus]